MASMVGHWVRIGGGVKGLVARFAASLTATVVAAAITGSYLAQETPLPPPGPAQDERAPIDDGFGKVLLDAAFTGGSVRSRPAYPVEFAAVFGPNSTRSPLSLTSAEWAEAPAREAPAGGRVRPKTTVAAAILPPQRPAEAAPAAPAQAREAARADEDRARLFGVALPGFVPRGETVVRTVVGLGEQVAGWADIF